MKPLSEVITNHIDDQNVLHVDVYETSDENEQGKTIAYVCLDTLKVIFSDNRYRLDETVQNAIKEVLELHKKPTATIVMTDFEDIYVYVNDELWTFEDHIQTFQTPNEARFAVICEKITSFANIKENTLYIGGSDWLDSNLGNPPNSLKEFIKLGE